MISGNNPFVRPPFVTTNPLRGTRVATHRGQQLPPSCEHKGSAELYTVAVASVRFHVDQLGPFRGLPDGMLGH